MGVIENLANLVNWRECYLLLLGSVQDLVAGPLRRPRGDNLFQHARPLESLRAILEPFLLPDFAPPDHFHQSGRRSWRCGDETDPFAILGLEREARRASGRVIANPLFHFAKLVRSEERRVGKR